ncbi:MAG: Glycosyltransferase, RfaG family [Candidatus Methanohalarchaeum thermophilum]|uniref:Glycosyltransferase, RfaG family n=1 Tax=Methanohalarchaeum thermophilum TaxID=1903181 RepID=A0A1Q6DVG5_METT1|nr:MAG: Glycosyltransferase, RfaG family [Candidatus Methanohalarchaeum thermophilum]
MIKIGLIVYGNLNQKSGGYLYDRRLIDYLRKKDTEIQIFPIRKPKNLFENKKTSSRLLKSILDKKIDLLLQDELTHASLTNLNNRLREKEVKLVSIVHHLGYLSDRCKFRKKLHKQIEKNYIKTVDNYIFNSKSTKKTVQNIKKDIKKDVIAYPGKDNFNYETKYHMTREKIKLLFVGNILPHKCLDILIKSLGLLDIPIELNIVGKKLDKKYMELLIKKTQKLGINNKVDFLGYLNKKELKEQYIDNDILILPSKFEGYGLVVVEAMGFGNPVIATNRGGPTELIEDKENGYLVEPNNPKKISNYISKFYEDKEKIKNFGKTSKEKFKRLTTWNKSLSNIWDFLRNLK